MVCCGGVFCGGAWARAVCSEWDCLGNCISVVESDCARSVDCQTFTWLRRDTCELRITVVVDQELHQELRFSEAVSFKARV